MFDEKEINLYKSITAPQELKHKIMSMHPYRKLVAVVASVVLLLSISAAWDWNHSVMSVQMKPQQTMMAVQESREISQTTVSLEFSTNRKRQVEVSAGSLRSKNMASGQKMWIKEDSTICWDFKEDVAEGSKLYITGWGKDQEFLLIYNQETNAWELKEQ